MKLSRAWLLPAWMALAGLGGCAAVDSPQSSVESVSPHRELQTQSERSDDQKRAGIRLQLAIGYYEQRQFDVALDEIRKALLADPNFADAYSVRALIYTAMGENRLAEDNFNRALQLSPGNPEYLNNFGWFLCQNGQELRALGMFEAVLNNRTYQSPAKALNNAGFCSLKLKDATRAERYFLQSFQMDPGNAATNFHLAGIYHEKKNNEQAKFYINRVIRADSATAEALWLAIKIERRLGDAAAEASLATQLRRRYPNSSQYAAYQRGAYDE